MDIAINWLLVLGPLFIGIALAIWGFADGSRTLALWMGIFGGALLLLAGGLQLQQMIRKADKTAGSTEAEMKDLRAYIFVDTVRTINTDDDVTKIDPTRIQSVEIVIRNFGKTPASHVLHIATLKFTDFPPGPDTFNPLPQTGPTSIDILPPTGQALKALDAGMALDLPRKQLLKAGNKAIYVFGRIDYLDAFNITRCTRYRYMVGGNAGFHGVDMFKMAEGNEVDKNCENPN